MLLNDVPPLVLTCHCTVSVLPGLSVTAVKETLWPALTVLLAGCVVTVKLTVNVAGLLVSVPEAVGEHGLVLVAVLRGGGR